MQLEEILRTFGYAGSPNLLRAGGRELESAPAVGHVFRHAVAKRGLKGVYSLRPPGNGGNEPLVPIVYVCDAPSEDEADRTHRLVWNQDIVPFVLVNTPDSVRLYSGFRYRRRHNGPAEGLLSTLRTAHEILALADTLSAEAIDDGRVWRTWGNEVRPDARVDWQLLENLRRLDQWLRKNGLEPDVSHALIGKYVYLRYLKDRDILSKRKLESWGITEQEIFSREATLAGVERAIDRLDDWLNGQIFPLHFGLRNSPKQEHLRRVAATFMGDQPLGDDSWQLHLDFQAYDFSYIPIETLSVVYEQFLHMPSEISVTTRGREAGAYYTPIPVVNFMLAEMDDRHPLKRGMRVVDPACGSGAFLVQCYRRLIEREYPPHGSAPGLIKLRELLQEHIFGVDRDADACSVTELSLILTLLDYVNPPDLENDKRVKLPILRNQNIFCEDFFAEGASWRNLVSREKLDWIVGNPPWKRLNPARLNADDNFAWQFMIAARKRGEPVVGNQLAQAFIWGAAECLIPSGQAALLVPAMTLFDTQSRDFRATFLKTYQLQSVANFSNLAEVLFAGRSRVPAAALFFKLRKKKGVIPDDEIISNYAPFVANQEPTRPVAENTRQQTWSLVLNASEVREVPTIAAADGDALPWKLAAWGSDLDARLLHRVAKGCRSLGQIEDDGLLKLSEGLQLREARGGEAVDPVPEVIGKRKLDVTQLQAMRHFFAFPDNAFKEISAEMAHVRRGRGELPLSVCRPPHIIVGETRNFAILTDEFIVVPPGQVGIASPTNDRDFLIVLSLFLSSDFAFYHQFFCAPKLGVKRPIASLSALREMPVPVAQLQGTNSRKWHDLHKRLVQATRSRFRATPPTLFAEGSAAIADERLLRELNDLAFDALELTDLERALVRDLVQVKLELDDGKLGQNAVRAPSPADLKRYAKHLKAELDGFVEGELERAHRVRVLTDDTSGLVVIELAGPRDFPNGAETYRLGDTEAAELTELRSRLRRERSQWVYFDRNLRVFESERTLILKPLQRFHWTVSQAVSDANEVISETLALQGDET
jgi:hypothetical protein